MTLDVPRLLERIRAGDESALNELVAELYGELHRIAARQLRGERPSHTLQPTALVHEAYLKLLGGGDRRFADRVHFLSVASRTMRQVLVDYARARATKKRDGVAAGNYQEELAGGITLQVDDRVAGVELLDLDYALEALGRGDEALARLIEMSYFGGMTAEEIADVLGQSVHIVRHDLRLAQAWLRRKLSA